MARSTKYREQHDHIAVVQHLRQRAVPGLVWWHSPQGAAMVGRQGALMKALGMKAGVSDLVFLHRGQFYALELKKRTGGRASAEQKQFLDDVIRAGGHAYLAAGLDDALARIEQWELVRGQTEFQGDMFAAGTRDGVARRASHKG